VKKGIFGIHELVLKWDKIQSVHLDQSLYQKRVHLATVKLNTAGGKIILPWLALQQAKQIRNYALYKIESSSRPWS
jgi:membrane protein YdbS with pleckstrin-like domain